MLLYTLIHRPSELENGVERRKTGVRRDQMGMKHRRAALRSCQDRMCCSANQAGCLPLLRPAMKPFVCLVVPGHCLPCAGTLGLSQFTLL